MTTRIYNFIGYHIDLVRVSAISPTTVRKKLYSFSVDILGISETLHCQCSDLQRVETERENLLYAWRNMVGDPHE